VKRRELITLLGGAAAVWSVSARAQQPATPVVGMLLSSTRETFADHWPRGFRQGLKDTGYVEGENVAIDYRWAENQLDRLPALAAELVRRRVAVIITPGPAILDRHLFDAVQSKLNDQKTSRTATRTKSDALLIGRIYDDHGNRMSPSHARKLSGAEGRSIQRSVQRRRQ